MSHPTPEGEVFRRALGEEPGSAQVLIVGVRDGPEGPGVLLGVGDVIVRVSDRQTLCRLVGGLIRAGGFVFGPEEM